SRVTSSRLPRKDSIRLVTRGRVRVAKRHARLCREARRRSRTHAAGRSYDRVARLSRRAPGEAAEVRSGEAEGPLRTAYALALGERYVFLNQPRGEGR